MARVNYFIWAGASKTTCFEMKAIWVCFLFHLSLPLGLSLIGRDKAKETKLTKKIGTLNRALHPLRLLRRLLNRHVEERAGRECGAQQQGGGRGEFGLKCCPIIFLEQEVKSRTSNRGFREMGGVWVFLIVI